MKRDTHDTCRSRADRYGGQPPNRSKVGMITTLSGGGAGLGIDVRDGFMLALKQAEGTRDRADRRG